jgi:hypothetical protein
MTTTPDTASPDEHDDGQDDATAPNDSGTQGGAGAEIGMTDGEGSTFEPEEDPDGQA